MGGCLSKNSSTDDRSEKYKAPKDNKREKENGNDGAGAAAISESSVELQVNPSKDVKPTPPPVVDQAAQEQKLHLIFHQVDQDHSGFIDVAELKVILEKMNLRVDHENVMFLMSRYDDDGNGKLNFEEFSEMILSIMNVKKQFENADHDKSGAISASEMQALMQNMALTSDVAKQVLHLFDEDGSGVVEYSEFVTLVFYLNELEYQYKNFKQRGGDDYSWLCPMLGPENSGKAPALAKELQALKSSKKFPTLNEFTRPIVLAAAGAQDPMGRKKKPPRIKTQRARVRPPPKKMLKIQPTQIKRFSNDGTLFCDPNFPPHADVLPSRVRDRVAAWKRPSEIASNAKLFVNGVEEGDVIQGSLGDCWFLGALAVVATSTENFIEHLYVQQKPEIGYYQCRFFKNGKWEFVEVDDRLPCDSRGNLIFASCKDPSEFWVPIVEKAYAKLHGSYDALESGNISDGLKDLTGEGVEVMVLDSADFRANSDIAWNSLLNNVGESFLMGCAIDDPQLSAETELNCGLLVSHAYSIINCQELLGAKLLRMRNPWGQGEWNGRWSDDSKEWTPTLLKQLNYQFANDGTFFMCFQDFVKYYSRVYVLRLLTDSTGEVWNKTAIEGLWHGESAAGCANNAGWLNNPQYALKVLHPNTKLFVNLSQPDLRFVQKKSPALIETEYDAIGLYILKAKDLVYRKTSYQPDEKVATSTFTTVRDLSFECTCAPGNYVVIPCTFNPHVEIKYGLTLYASKPVEVIELTKVIPSKKLNSEWRGITAGGCANNRDSWINNPQFLLVCSSPGTVEILLSQESIPNKPLEAIAIYVLGSTSKARLRTIETVLVKPSTIINLATVSETMKVEANVNYIIMPTTFEPAKERKFTISVASDTATIAVFTPL